MAPAPQSFFASRQVTNGCVKCTLRAREVPVAECAACTRGFLVRYDGEPRAVMCPTDLKLTVVSDLMNTRVIAARPHLPIENLILLLVDEGIAAVPVVDAEHRPIGMASKSDLVFDRYEWAELRDEDNSLRRVAKISLSDDETLHLDELLSSRTVGDIMSGDPITVRADLPALEAAALMAERNVHGLPVTDHDGRLIGMLTSLDIARWVGAQRP